MDLTVTEAAELLGLSPRTLRARIARGLVQARKVDGSWRIERGSLPLTEAQRSRIAARAQAAREALERSLPERWTQGRTVLDLDAFRWGAEVLDILRSRPEHSASAARLAEALRELAGAAHTWDRSRKLSALERARTGVGEAAGLLVLSAPLPPEADTLLALRRLEAQVSPAIAGLARWSSHRFREER